MSCRFSPKRDARPGPFGEMPGPRLHELLIEQLVEREPPAAELRFFDALGAMHELERTTQLDQIVALAKRGRMRIADERQQRVEMLLNQLTNLAMGQPFSGRIHG